MASYIKRGRRWRAQIDLRGIRDGGTFDTKAQAQSWATKREAEILAGIRGEVIPNTLRDALTRYRERISPRKRGAKWEITRLKQFERSMKPIDRLLHEIAASEIADWRDTRLSQVGPASVRREMALLRSVFEVARKEWGWVRVNPMTDVAKPPNPPHRDRVITDDERDRLVMALGYLRGRAPTRMSHYVAIGFLLALETGMRAGEIWSLDWSRISLQGRFLTLHTTKNGDRRDVPLSTTAVALLEALPTRSGRAFAVSPASADALFRKARQRAGIEGLTFHDSRATALTRLSRKIDVLDLARMIGHRSPASLMVYYRASATEIAARLG